MERHARGRREVVWFAAILLTTAPLLVALCKAMWQAPYPITETVSLLEDVDHASLQSIFDPSARSWYRPFYHLTWYVFLHGAPSLDAALLWFRCLEVGAIVALVVLLVWHLRPRTVIDGAAATFAVAVLLGMPGFRDNLELPLLMTLVGMPLALVVWMILERDASAWHAPAIVALMLIAVGFKEQGLVIAPLVVAAWWMGAPGATRTTAIVVTVSVVAYLALRLSTTGSWKPFEQDVGLGFDVLSASDASARFGAFPFWMYAYNAASTVANILFSEPTAGRFRIVWDVSQGQADPWEINHVVSSMVLTGLVAWWGIGVLRRTAGRPWTAESRMAIAAALAVAASGALGFNYSRDRLGGMAVVFLAMAAYFAMREAGERAVRASTGRMAAAGVALLLLAAAWQVRALGTVDDVRVMSESTYVQWMTDLQSRRKDFADRSRYLQIMEAMAEQGLNPASAQGTSYPRWARVWLGEE